MYYVRTMYTMFEALFLSMEP